MLNKLSRHSLNFITIIFWGLLSFSSSIIFAQNTEIIIKFKTSDSFKFGKTALQDSSFFHDLQKNIGAFSTHSLLPKKLNLNSLNKAPLTPFNFVYILKNENEEFSQALLDSLNSLQEIEYACFNKLLKIHQSSNDPEISRQWGLARIHIEEAWQKTRGSDLVPIVVIDTGIETTHEDLRSQMWRNRGEELNGLDDDENGFVDDVSGWDFTDAPRYPDSGDYIGRDNNPEDEHGHGTSVAGIIAAGTGNGIGVAGVAPDCKIVNLRAFTSQGIGEEDDVAAAILYAVQMGFRIINMSFGDVLITPLLWDVIKYAYKNDVIMIASSGNSGDNNIHYPSGLAETISVGATNEADQRAGFSSFGSSLDLVAPGNAIFTTLLENSYGEVGGTSASAPFVSGVAGLILSLYPEISIEMMRSRLQQSCEDLGESGWDFEFGAGILRADQAVLEYGPATVKINSPFQNQGFNGGTIPVVATCAGALITGYELFVAEGLNPTDWENLIPITDRQIISEFLLNWSIPDQIDTSYTFRLVGYLRDGKILEDYVSIITDFSPPVVSDFNQFPIYSNGEPGHLFGFNTDDFTDVTLNIRPVNSDQFQSEKLEFQNRQHSGLLFGGDQEFYFEIKNQTGLKTIYPEPPLLLPFSVDQTQIFDFLQSTGKYLSPGYLLFFTVDIDNDRKTEILINEYDEKYNFGHLAYWKNEKTQFTRMTKDSGISFCIPRDVADVNGDGNLEVLGGRGKQSIIYRYTVGGIDPYPQSSVWSDTNDVWASRFFDFNGDSLPELVTRVGNEWEIWQNNGGFSFTSFSKLPNNTEGENGSGVPHVEIGDFDKDNQTEILYGDYDGDILLYEISTSLQPTFEWSDRLPLIDAIDFIASGDFDGDGQLEFAAGCHSRDAIDLEHQFNDRHWLFRIYDFAAGNYQVVWEQRFYPYFPPKDFDSGLSSGDVNGDGLDDLLIGIHPNLYLVSYDLISNKYKVSGHFEGIRSNRIIVFDFDKDGANELLFNTGEATRLFEYQKEEPIIPIAPGNLSAVALDSECVQLTWDNFIPPDSFRVYRGTEKDMLNLLADNWTEKNFVDSTVITDQKYWYQISKLQSDIPETYSKKVSVTPHRPARFVKSKVFHPNQLLLSFSLPMSKTVINNEAYLLQSAGLNPMTATQSSNLGEVLLSWGNDFIFPKIDTLVLSTLADSSGTPIDKRDLRVAIQNSVVPNAPYIINAEFVGQNKLQVEFNEPMEVSSLIKKDNYQFEPNATILDVKSIEPGHKIIEIEIYPNVPIGPIGKEYDLYVRNVFSQAGVQIDQKIGHRVTFIFVAKNLSNVYVYPNPAKDHITFARLTNEAEIEIYNSSGILLKKFAAKTINGGFDWNLLDEHFNKIQSGVYIFRVYNENESHWGKFAVVR